LAAGHVVHLSGSELAKLRLAAILETMQGKLTVAEACARLGVRESRFHALRNQWLQEALALLEPRPVGRPAKQTAAEAEQARQLAALEAELRRLKQQAQIADVCQEIGAILSPSAAGVLGKKTFSAPLRPRRPRRQFPRRPPRPR
jgi:transposase-like protein